MTRPIPARSLVDDVLASTGAALVGAESRKRLVRVGADMPPPRGGIALECRLAAGAERVDLTVRVFRRDAPAWLETGVAYLEPVRRFARRWTSDPALDSILYVDVELDLGEEAPTSFVGAMIEPRLHDGVPAIVAGAARRAGSLRASSFEVAAAVLRVAEASPVSGAALATVARCYAALPGHGFIGHLGSLRCRSPRGGDRVRLIASLPRRRLRSYLREIEWPGDVASLEAAVNRFDRRRDRVDLDLDVTDAGLQGETGFYVTFRRPAEEGWILRPTLRELRVAGFLDPSRASALARFAKKGVGPRRHSRSLTLKLKSGPGSWSSKAYLSLLETA